MSTVIFGFLLLAWMLAFITLNASLAVVRASKELRVNPYLRASTVLSSRAFALGLAAELTNRDLRSRCSQSGNLYSCISNGNSQGSFGALMPLSRYACTSGDEKLLGELERGITSCIRNFRLDWNSLQGEGYLAVETATGKNGAFLHQTDRLELKSRNANTPTLLVAWPGSGGSCASEYQKTITSHPQSTVEGNVLTLCGPPIFGCSTLETSQNNWVQEPNPGGRQGFWLDGCLSNRKAIPNLHINPSLIEPVDSASINSILTEPYCQTTSSSLQCLGTSVSNPIKFVPGSGDLEITSPISISSGAAIIMTCRNINWTGGGETVSTSTGTRGALILIRMNYTPPDLVSECINDRTITIQAQNLLNGISIIAPGQSVTFTGSGNSTNIYGIILARSMKLRGIKLRDDALKEGVSSDTKSALNRIFPTLLSDIQVEDIRATGLSGSN